MSNAAAPATEAPDPSGAPLHVAIIMDGNGRWAAARGLPRAEGHRRGVEALRRVVRAANELGILYLTIFSFSSENWSRPATEIGDLFGLLRRFIRNDLADIASRRRPGPDHRRARRIGAGYLRAAERGGRADQGQYQAQPRGRVQLRFAPGNRQARRSGWRARSRRANAIRRRSTLTRSADTSMRPTFPIPI